MEVIYILIPGMILMGIILVAVLVIAIRKGQYDDLEGDGARILMDDDLMPDAPEPSKMHAMESEELTEEEKKKQPGVE